MMLNQLDLGLDRSGWTRLAAELAPDPHDRAWEKTTLKMDETPDQTLVLRTRRGEVEAFGDLVRRYQGSVFNVCYRLLGERREAEDLAQETFIRAYRRLETFDEARPFGPWIRRVAANLCYNHLKRNRLVQVELDEERDTAPEAARSFPERSQERRETYEEIQTAVLGLPPAYRAVIELRHYQEMSYTEISDALGISMSQVKSHLFRGRKALAQRLTSTGSLRADEVGRGELSDAD